MAADSNIFAQYLRPVKSMQDYGNDMDAAEQNRLTLQSGRMKAQQDQQAMTDDNSLRAAYQQSGGDPTKYRNALIGLGNAKAVQAFDAADLEAKGKRATIGKTDADTSASQVATTIKKLEYGASILSTAKDDQTYAIALQTLESVFPGATKEMPPQFDPQVVASKLASGQTIKDKLAAQLAQATQAQTVVRDTQTNDRGIASNLTTQRGQDMTAGTAKAGQAITVRGQNMVDSRARESTAASMSKPFEVTGPDGNPVLVQQDKQGNITPVSGYKPKGGAEKPLNDTQSKALLFGSRMREAGKVLDSLAKDGTLASVPGSRSGYGVGATVTALSSSKQQQLDQAKRDFVNAVLRRESGAVIADSEFENADKQYFPQIGDSKAVVEQKKRNRELATNGILQEVPENRRNGLQPQAQMPTADDVRKQADNILKGG